MSRLMFRGNKFWHGLTTKEEVESTCEDIKESMNYLIDRNAALRKENTELKDKHYKQKAIAKLREELNETKHIVNNSYQISEWEDNRAQEWIKKHKKECHGGKAFSPYYTFMPSPLGCTKIVGCCECRHEKKTYSSDVEYIFAVPW